MMIFRQNTLFRSEASPYLGCCSLLVYSIFGVPNDDGNAFFAQTEGHTCILHSAFALGDVAALKKAIDDGADVNAIDARTNPNGRRALNWAAWYNHAEAIKELLKGGADINGVNLTGFTPIHHAAEAGSPEAARVLIEAGADVNLPSYAGETPLQRARRVGHQEVVRLLEAAGAK